MAEHYTRNTESCLAFCPKCGTLTKHKVSDGRRGRCMEHDAGESKKQIAASEKREREQKRAAENPPLFHE